MDVTREAGLAAQRGVRDARKWQFGPFYAMNISTQTVSAYAIGVLVGNLSLCIAVNWGAE